MSTKKRANERAAKTAEPKAPHASPLEASPDNTPIVVTETHIPQAVGPNEEGLLDQVSGVHTAGEDHRQRLAKHSKKET